MNLESDVVQMAHHGQDGVGENHLSGSPSGNLLLACSGLALGQYEGRSGRRRFLQYDENTGMDGADRSPEKLCCQGRRSGAPLRMEWYRDMQL